MSKFLVTVVFSLFALAGHSQPKQVLNILFVGKTQTGKSSLVNIFYNHIVGKRYEDERAIVIPLRDGADELHVNVAPYHSYQVELRELAESQTTKVLRYTAENDKFIVHLWDAPGFNDTNQKVTDEEIVNRIASAIGTTSFNMIAIVLRPNEPATFDMKANIDRVRTMLPKTAARNIAGVFTRATNLSKGVRNANAQVFAQLLEMTHADTAPNVYNIDGSSFFDEGDFDGAARWFADDEVVHQLLTDAARLEPFDAQQVVAIQNVMDRMRATALQRTAVIKSANDASAEMGRFSAEHLAAEQRRDANRGFEQRRTVTVETRETVRCRALGFLWSYDCGTETRYHYRTELFTDEAQKSRYFQARDEAFSHYKQMLASRHRKDLSALQEAALLHELRNLKDVWMLLALSTNVCSFIVYLDHQIRSAEREISCDETSRKNRIASLESQKIFYEFIRDL